MSKTQMTYTEGAGRVTVSREATGGWRLLATPGAESKIGDVVVAHAERNEAGFRGRQWEVTLPGGGTVGEGQFGTLESAARATLDLAKSRYQMTREMERIAWDQANARDRQTADLVAAHTTQRLMPVPTAFQPSQGGAWEQVPAAIAQLVDEADYRRQQGTSTFRLSAVVVDGDRDNEGGLTVRLLDSTGKRFIYRAHINRDGRTEIDD